MVEEEYHNGTEEGVFERGFSQRECMIKGRHRFRNF
jgi:hypothetical protein